MVDAALQRGILIAAEPSAVGDAAKTSSLPEPVRQIAYMALIGIALLGMLMIVATLLGGHWVRRWGDRVRSPTVPPDILIPRPSESKPPQPPQEPKNDGDTMGGSDTTIG